MGIFRQFAYSNTGTEIDFAQGLIDKLCEIDNLTCATTAAEQYADRTGATRATFTFKWKNKEVFSFARRYTNNMADCVLGVTFTSRDNYIDTVMVRSANIAYYISDSCAFIWLMNFNISSISQAAPAFGIIEIGDDIFSASYTSNILGATFSDGSVSMTFQPILPYSAGAGNVDYVEKSVFISSGMKYLETEDIKSCSTMPQWASIALPDGRNFYTIATNAMVEIDTEEDDS